MTVPASDSGGLISAIACANATPTNDVINLTNSTYTLTTSMPSTTTGVPTILTTATAGTLTINGNGATITRSAAGGTPNFRLFMVNNFGNLTLATMRLTNGLSGYGGAIRNNGTLTITDSTLSGNTVTVGGGAIGNFAGTVTLNRSTLSGNTASFGSAMYIEQGTMRLINSTLSGNTSTSFDFYSAAVYSGESPTIVIINSTITANTANSGPGGLNLNGTTVTIQNSIVANNNGANNCAVTGGTFTDGGNNLDNGTSCGFSGAVGQNTNPQLGALANNGGVTQTHALLTGSPAINAGNNAKAVDAFGAALTTDQRGAGFARITNTTVDIGAYEAVTGSLSVQMTLEGRANPAPHVSRVVTINVQVRPQGGGTVFYNQNFTTSSSSAFSIPNLPTGTYLFTFKGTHTLARQMTLTITTGANIATTSVMLEGDANGNNLVNVSDFSLLATAFGKTSIQVGYNALTDFNNDGIVNISDFSLMATNFSKTGDGGVTP